MKLNHHQTGARRPSKTAAQKGYVLVMFALLLVPMLLVAGLSVDVGSWYNRASDMRKAADAAALAGVVWLPDETSARSNALAAAGQNGFVNGGNITVSVTVSQVHDRRIRVSITDNSVGSFFWENLGGEDIALTRTAFAEYVLQVPLGSPRNYFGTGKLLNNVGMTPELLYQSVNTYGSSKVDGDRFQSKNPSNTEYRATGYQLYIEAKEGRPSAIDVLLYDARFRPNDPVPNGQTCSTRWRPSSSTWYDTRDGWPHTVNGPLEFQVRSSGSWGTTLTRGPGTHNLSSYGRVRYRYEEENCSENSEAAIDRYFGGSASNETYTFTLFGPDSTPLNDFDNPVACGPTPFTRTSAFDSAYSGYLGSSRWNNLCQITTGMDSGRYILRVTNAGSGSINGENNWGLVARYAGAASPALCDGRNDAMCPRVYGQDSISVRAVSDATTASFFLAEIAPEHNGKTLRISLWDPGEGGLYLRIKKPTGDGAVETDWTPVLFKWTSPGVSNSGETTDNLSLRTSGGSDRFNGRLLTIDVQLANYTPPTDNNWWKIEYQFSGSSVNDRTTWQAEVLGDPIHLVEEF